jgi:type VI secretion system protein
MTYSADDSAFFGVSLFERLDANAKPKSVTRGPDPEEVVESIRRNIARLLNARLGESLSSPELGLIDFNDATLGSHDLAVQIRHAIKRCIERFEPRVSSVDIRLLTDDTTLFNRKFHIVAQIDTGIFHRQVEIDLLLESNKQFRVR